MTKPKTTNNNNNNNNNLNNNLNNLNNLNNKIEQQTNKNTNNTITTTTTTPHSNHHSLQLINQSNSSSNQLAQSGGSALLLRLFQSHFFNVHLAISYLKTYQDSIGITYYLIDRLEQFPSRDVEFYWPQLCHLLISRPTQSYALESFIIKKSIHSTHLAIKTLWYLQASLFDLSSNPNTPNFIVCRRAFNRIQSVIFSDPLLELSAQRQLVDPRISKQSNFNLSPLAATSFQNAPSSSPIPHQLGSSNSKSASWKHTTRHAYNQLTRLKGGKITEKVLPTSVGIGLALAGVALPQLTHQTGHLPIEQSKNYDQSVTFSARLKSKHYDDNSNSASDEEESDHFHYQQAPPLRRYRSHNPSPSLHHKPTSKLTPETQLPLNHPSPSSHHPTHTFLPTSPIKSSSSPGSRPSRNSNQPYLEPSSLPSSPFTPIRSSPEVTSKPPSLNPLENRTRSSLLNPGILTAPISSIDHAFLTSSSNSSHIFHSNPQNPTQSSSHSYESPVIPSYSSRSNTSFVPVNSSPRVHPASVISQSAPSLPDALSKFKQERRFNHTNTSSIIHRNGRVSHHSNHPISPIGSLSSALSIDPSQIPVGLLHQVLKSQSMRSQLELITSLQDIATRLVVVPRKARLSALRAELTVLNHSLPKGCCLGMYCDGDHYDDSDDLDHKKSQDPTHLESQAASSSEDSNSKKRCHQRIVRISPNESVVLNSADRAPFLIHVEVLDDHLDFDPNRRSNHEDLRKAIKESAISTNYEIESSQERRSGYSDLTHQSSIRSESNSNTTAADHDKIIKSPARQLASSPLPTLLNQSFDHLQITPANLGPNLDRPSWNRAHSSENNRQNLDLDHHQSILDDPPRSSSRFIESSDHPPGLMFSSPPRYRTHHDRRASSFDFPEISTNFPVPEEEMDLVEQIYGQDSKCSQYSEDESDGCKYPYQSSGSSHLPPGWRNKALDEEAWKRAESSRKGAKQSPLSQTGHDQSGDPSVSKSISRSMSNPGSSSKPNESDSFTDLHLSASRLKSSTITLDEYAERMRMAAIMLAQLSASQQPSQSLTMTSSSAAGMVVGGAIGLGAGFVGVTVGAGLGAVVSRRLVGNGQTIITSPIGRKDSSNSSVAQNVNGQGSSGLSIKLDIGSADGKNARVGGTKSHDDASSRIGPASVPKQKLLTPQQSQAIKDRIMAEMMLLEEERMKRMRLDQLGYSYTNKNKIESSLEEEKEESKTNQRVEEEENLADEAIVMKAVNEEDPSGKMLSESWEKKRDRIRLSSPYGHLPNWNLFSVIVKTGTDLRQEQIIIQLIREFGRIWNEESCNVWVKYYGILVTGESTGLMETIVDAVSIHSLKKSAYSKLASIKQNSLKQHNSNHQHAGSSTGGLPNYSLFDHYVDTYGPPTGKKFKQAQENFMRSLVSYSIITYILQIKDRHNGNILIDKDGHIIHIDFGFVLNNSPGSIGFEMSPFKLNQDYLQVLNPPSSFISIADGKRHFFNDHHQNRGSLTSNQTHNDLNQFVQFVDLFKLSFKKIRKHAERIITIVELMQVESKLPCFGGGKSNIGENVVKNLRERFQLHLNSEEKLDEFVDKLVLSSINSVFTKLYDSFQYFSQGVL